MSFPRRPLAWAVTLALAPSAWAIEPKTAEPTELEPSVISASGLASKRHQMTTPAEVLEGDELVLRRESTLGETLESLPGVRSSSFGAGVGRPVIRGLDGARVKVLSDGVDVLDASTISPDHAITSEPLLAERIEVLKGPATLLYGGGAIGGVVNVIDRKIPTYVPEKGYEGELELRANSVANEGAGVFGITAGTGNFAVRAEGTKRQANDYEIPGSPGKQEGSYNDTDSFNLGGSFIGERGYIGLAYGEQNIRYGLLAHEHADCHTHGPGDWHCGGHGHGHAHDDEEHEGIPYVDMRQKRWDLRGELNDPLPGFELARLRVGHSDYQHKEIEEGEVATRFDNDATDARLELTHKPLFGWRGVLGAQTLRRDFEASGEEAYVPPTLTRNHGLFLLEEYTSGAWRYELGLRHEWQDIDATGAKDTRHSGTSVSAGTVWTFAPEYSLGFSLSRSQRLPTAQELYADGVHLATNTYELGNTGLGRETSRNIDLTLRKHSGDTTFSASVFHNRVKNYIYADTLDRYEDFRLIEYTQRDAEFTGVEGELRHQFTPVFSAAVFGDYVRGKLTGGDGNLPRIPAARAGVRGNFKWEQWSGGVEYARVFAQKDIADYEDTTPGYNMVNAVVAYRGQYGATGYEVYLRGTNLLNKLAYNHASFISSVAPLPGRSVMLGVRMTY